MKLLITSFAVGAQVANGFADGPQVRIVRVSLEASLIGKRQHLVVDAGGVANAQYIDATVDEFL